MTIHTDNTFDAFLGRYIDAKRAERIMFRNAQIRAEQAGNWYQAQQFDDEAKQIAAIIVRLESV